MQWYWYSRKTMKKMALRAFNTMKTVRSALQYYEIQYIVYFKLIQKELMTAAL